MKKTNKLISILLAVVMLLSMAPISVFAAETVASGSTSSTTWSIDSDGVLTIDGKNSTVAYRWNSAVIAPWDAYRDLVKKAVFVNCDNWTQIPDGTFRSHHNLTEVELPPNITRIGEYAFTSTAIRTVVLPDSVTLIDYDAFSLCENLTYINIPDGVETIRSYAFEGCAALKAISIPDSVTELGSSYTFGDCKSLTAVRLSNNITSLGSNVFYNSPIETLIIPANVTELGGQFIRNSGVKKLYYQGTAEPTTYNPGYNGDTFAGTLSAMNVYVPEAYPNTTMGIKKSWGGTVKTVTKINGYNVNLDYTANGVVTVDAGIAAQGDTVNIALVPYGGYEVESVSVKQGETDITVMGNGTNYSFVMPAGDVTVSAVFKESLHIHDFTYSAEGTTLKAVCSNTDGKCNYPVQQITANNSESYSFNKAYTRPVTFDGVIDGYYPEATYTMNGEPIEGEPCYPGEYVATVTKDNATVSISYSITKINPSASNFTCIKPSNLIYDGTVKEATVTVKDGVEGMGDYTVVYRLNSSSGEIVQPIKAGKYYVTVDVAEGEYYSARERISLTNFTITCDHTACGMDYVPNNDGTHNEIYGCGTITSNVDCSFVDDVCEYCEYVCLHEGQTGANCGICGAALHTHSFTYSASGDTITAICENTDGGCPESEGTLTISAPADLYTDGTTAKEAVIDNQLVEAVDYTVTYSTADGNAPKTAGTYTASVTIGGATASVKFTLLNYVASVTDKDGKLIGNYKTFADAVTAAENSEDSTLTLLDNITLTAKQYISSGKFTLDLNSNTLFNETATTLLIQSGADVTIMDSGEGGTVKSNEASSSAILNYGTLTVESGNIINENKAVDNHGTLTVNGGSFEGKNYALYISMGTAEIFGGEFNGTVWGFASYTVNGGDFTEGYIGINCEGGVLTVNGGTFDINEIEIYRGTVSLSGGEFKNGITVSDLKFDSDAEKFAATILADGYYYKDADGKIITVANNANAISGYAKVAKGADFANDAVITLSQTEYEYNGGENKPAVTVTVGGKTLDSANYTVSYADNINAGTATVTVTAVASDIYSGTATANFTITKAEISVTAPVANTLTYNGSAQALITAGSANVGEMQYSTDGVEYSATIPTATNAGDYTVYYKVIGDANYNDTEPATVTVTIKTKDISDAFIILGDALTYTGEEQTQSVTSVTVDGLDVTYDISGNKATNVGVYLLTVTGNGNFSGEAKLAYEIAPDTTSIDALTTENVTSADKASIEAVKAQIDNAVTDLADDETKAEYKAIADKCVELLKMIESVENQIESFNNELAKYNINTVTSDDNDALVNLYNSVNSFTAEYNDNLTEAETKEFDNILSGISALQTRISDVANEITRITDAVNSYDEETVKSSDKADIEQLKSDIKELTDGQNLTADEREYLINADAECDKLLAKIAETKSEYDRVIAAANGYDEATVTSADNDALVQLNEDIYALALTDNVTAEEKENLQAAHDKVLGLIDKLTCISDEIKRIIEAVDKYVFESVKSSDKADIQHLIADIKALLDTQNITADERTLLEGADETCDKLIAKIDETVAEINRITDAVNSYDEETVKYSDYTDILQLIDDIEALTDGQNITDDERASLEELNAKANLLAAKIRSTADEIARITNAVNTYSIDTVKSSDKADLEQLIDDIKALTDATNITDDERTKLGELDATLDALIKKIDDTAAEIARIDEAVNAYDEETVKSSDEEAINKLKEDIQALIDGDNLTEEEKAALEADGKAIDEIVEKLTEVAEEIKRVDEAVKSYDEETVKSSDKADLEQLKEDIQALIDSTNTTENEKTALGEMIEKINALLDKISETEEKLEEIKGIENNYNPENITSDDKAAIEEILTEIEAVNPDNLTDEQKAEYEEIKAGFDALLEEIEKAGSEVEAIGAELEMFDEKRVTIFWEDDIEALKAKIDELLADENMGTAEKAKLNEYKAQCDKLIEIIHTPVEYFSLRLFYFIWDCLTWKCNGILWIFSKIFGC